MATLILEDGTGVTDANSYAVAADFQTYYEDREVNIDDFDTTQMEVGLIEASKYLDLRWGQYFKGSIAVETQGLEFPRSYLYDRYGNVVNGLPAPIVEAAILYALEWLNDNLYPDTSTSSAKEVKKKKTVVGPITTEVEYVGSVSQGSALKFPLADKLVKQYTTGSNGSASVMRN